MTERWGYLFVGIGALWWAAFFWSLIARGLAARRRRRILWTQIIAQTATPAAQTHTLVTFSLRPRR